MESEASRPKETSRGGIAMVQPEMATTLAVQSLVQLCSDLRLHPNFKVSERVHQPAGDRREFDVIVQLFGDAKFHKYTSTCSATDLVLYRGLLLKVVTDGAVTQLVSAAVQQAFLPKFENEEDDTRIADAIVAQAHERFLVATIKHSGSLVTLSAEGFASKNDSCNEFTAGGAVLLRAHFDRMFGDEGAQHLAKFMQVLRTRTMAVSFEMVTGCHGHHGQIPAAEYLVATAAHEADPQAGGPRFLAWREFLAFCLEQSLPINDTWLFAGSQWVTTARTLLDDLSTTGGVTRQALARLKQLVQEGGSAGCFHVQGTYPHDQWQGSRLEGFVVAQGQPVNDQEEHQALACLAQQAQAQVLQLSAMPAHLQRPYQALQGALGQQQTVQQVKAERLGQLLQAVRSREEEWLPSPTLKASEVDVMKLFEIKQVPHSFYQLPNGSYTCARATLASLSGPGLLSELRQAQLLVGADCGGLQQMVEMLEQLEQLIEEGNLIPPECSRPSAEGVQAGAGAAAAELAEGADMADKAAAAEAVWKAHDAAVEKLVKIRARAPRALFGAPAVATSLRYKKKMLLWQLGSVANQGMSAQEPGVGYQLMTYIIRNGLKILREQGEQAYLAEAQRKSNTWGLTRNQQGQVDMFARAWASWAAKQPGGVEKGITEETYLDVAEPFVKYFLMCMAKGDLASLLGTDRPKDAFQGILVLLDEPDRERALAVQASLYASHFVDLSISESVRPNLTGADPRRGAPNPKKADAPAFSRSLIAQGTVLWLPPSEAQLPKGVKPLIEAAGGAVFCATVRPVPDEAEDTPDCKRKRGMAHGRRTVIEYAMQAGKARESNRRLMDASYLAGEIAEWVGPGEPVPPADPAAICCFISIPGMGKTVLTNGLTQLNGLRAQLVSLNSDKLRTSVKGFQMNRYWNFVAGAAETSVGGGAVTVVVADKNLVPSPPGNIQRVLTTLKDSGAVTVAVVPTCRGPPAQDLGVPCPELPFPLELVALCMLRTLLRKKHEGNLDASLDCAMAVVIMFITFFKNRTRSSLIHTLSSQFMVVHELNVMQLHGEDPEKRVPLELLQHIAKGVTTFKESAKPQLDAAWERRARDLLLHPATQARLLSLQSPLAECQAGLQAALQEGLTAARSQAATQAAATLCNALTHGVHVQESPTRLQWVSVAGFNDETRLRALLPEGQVKSDLHVTLWHSADPEYGTNLAMRDTLLAAKGTCVEFKVVSVDHWPGHVTAAQVQLVSAPELSFSNPYLHITLAVGQGSLAKHAKQLPQRVVDGQATRTLLEEPLLLTGTIQVFKRG